MRVIILLILATATATANADADLDRQKAWLRNREEQKTREAYGTSQFVQQNQPVDHEKLHRCLMAVTATPRLNGYAAANARVNCYRGTKGLSPECESSVASTPLLSIAETNSLQAICRTFN